MANHYMEFSEILKLPEDFDKEKVEKVIAEVRDMHIDEDGDGFSVEYSFEDEDLWIRSVGECGDPDMAAEVAHWVMKFLDIDGYFRLNYCYYCSKLSPGEFGGGTVIATKTGTRSITPGAIAAQIENAMEKGAKITDDIPITIC